MSTFTASHPLARADIRRAFATRTESVLLMFAERTAARVDQRIARRADGQFRQTSSHEHASAGRARHVAAAHALGLL